MERMYSQKHASHFHVPKFLANNKTKESFIHWTAGLISGLTSITIFSPLELARTRHILLVEIYIPHNINFASQLPKALERSSTRAFFRL